MSNSQLFLVLLGRTAPVSLWFDLSICPNGHLKMQTFSLFQVRFQFALGGRGGGGGKPSERSPLLLAPLEMLGMIFCMFVGGSKDWTPTGNKGCTPVGVKSGDSLSLFFL